MSFLWCSEKTIRVSTRTAASSERSVSMERSSSATRSASLRSEATHGSSGVRRVSVEEADEWRWLWEASVSCSLVEGLRTSLGGSDFGLGTGTGGLTLSEVEPTLLRKPDWLFLD